MNLGVSGVTKKETGMSTSTQAWNPPVDARTPEIVAGPAIRMLSRTARRYFLAWTAAW
jgi:hypothetical protein